MTAMPFCRRHIVDEDQLFRESSFPIPPKKLVRLAKMFLATEAIGNMMGQGRKVVKEGEAIGGPSGKKRRGDQVIRGT